MKIKKFYESISEIEIGDYVICKDNEDYQDFEYNFQMFLDENIGIVVDTNKNKNGFFQSAVGRRFTGHLEKLFLVHFETKLPDYIMESEEFPENSLVFLENEIIDHSKDKKKLEVKLVAKKYNL